LLPLKDNIPTVRRPYVTYALIATNLLVWLLYEHAGAEPGLDNSVTSSGYFPCDVGGSCQAPGHPWPVTAITAMFLHAGWAHLLGNMLFLWIFGNNVEDRLGRFRFVCLYLLGGLAATAAQTFVTLQWGTASDAQIPNVGASGAIAAVLGAYILLYPGATVLTWIAPIFILPIPAVLYLGIWFGLQLLLGSSSFTSPEAGGGVAYFAHIGGFVFGLAAVRYILVPRRRIL
jgi:membrane associated rhomboid family serine protease